MRWRRFSDTAEDGGTVEKNHPADENGKPRDDDEMVSVQLSGAAGDLGRNVQSRTKNGPASGKRKQLNRDGNIAGFMVPARSRNNASSLRFK